MSSTKGGMHNQWRSNVLLRRDIYTAARNNTDHGKVDVIGFMNEIYGRSARRNVKQLVIAHPKRLKKP